MARRRLGKKISYLSLYEYAFIVDKHEEEMAELKQKMSKLRTSSRRQSMESNKELRMKVEKLEALVEKLMNEKEKWTIIKKW